MSAGCGHPLPRLVVDDDDNGRANNLRSGAVKLAFEFWVNKTTETANLLIEPLIQSVSTKFVVFYSNPIFLKR